MNAMQSRLGYTPSSRFNTCDIIRFFHGNSRDVVYWTILVFLWVKLPFYMSSILNSIFACRHRIKLQDPDAPGICINRMASIIATVIINITSDFSLLLLLAFSFWKPKMTTNYKMAIAANFGIGLL